MQVNKTYGINGLSEWYGKLSVGSISTNVAFTGGTASPSGARPAYMVTKDPIVQFIIENSKEFKEGFIHIEMVQELPGNHPRMAVPQAAPKKAAAKPKEEKPAEANHGTAEPEHTGEPAPADESDSVFPEIKGTQAARDFLASKYGIDPSRIKGKDDARSIAAELNISFPNL